MKSKSLALITIAIIAVSAILLTGSLSFLHISAFDSSMNEAVVDGDTTSPYENDFPEIAPEDENAIKDEADSGDAVLPEEDTSELPTPEVTPEKPKYDYPDFDYNIADARDMHYCGCKQDNPHSSHYERLKGVTIDIYSHKTGELVGQLALESEEIENYISQLVEEEFNPWAQTFEPGYNEEAVNLPEGDYRIEVYSGVWYSYTYGNNSMFELTQCTLTFYGGEKMTGYIDYLISDYIAQIEAGNVEKPNPKHAVSKLEFKGLEGYWYGYWVDEYQWTPNGWIGYQYEGAGRFTERFPYAEEK